jgi:hypothetical protein
VARVILFLPLLGGTEASFPLALFTTLADTGVDELPLVNGVGTTGVVFLTTGVVFFDFGVALPTSFSLGFPLVEAVAFTAPPLLIAIAFAAAILIAAVFTAALFAAALFAAAMGLTARAFCAL